MEPKTPSPDHVEFDAICAEVDDFEPLPVVDETIPVRVEEGEDDSPVDGQLLAGLVSPGLSGAPGF